MSEGTRHPYDCRTCGHQLDAEGRCGHCDNKAAERHRAHLTEMMGGPPVDPKEAGK